jgi:cation diffusion facilitator family transporter
MDMGANCQDHCAADGGFTGASPDYKRALWTVVAINAAMFGVEITAGALSGSMALQADALDFAADAATYGISLWAIGKALKTRATVALIKGVSLAIMAAAVLGLAIYQTFILATPEATTMSVVGLMALAANVISAIILMRYKDGDANVRSVWLCTRNDAIGNVAVVIAGVLVAWTASAWPDLIVAMGMAALFLTSSISILRQAVGELRTGKASDVGHSHVH